MSPAAADGERMDDGGREPSSSYEHDYQPSVWYSPMYWNSPVMVSSSSSSGGSSSLGGGDTMDIDLDMADSREQDDIQIERETDHGDTVFDRAAGPNKRVTAGTEETTEAVAMTTAEDTHNNDQQQEQQNQDQGQENPSKRRLVVPGTTATSVAQTFFDSIPPLTGRAQTVVEYTAPASFTPLFYFIGWTPFAIKWVATMYICHAFQCIATAWGQSKDGFIIFATFAWIPPLLHNLMDTYIWNHSMITFMLLKPEWFDGGPEANATVSAYTVACFFTMAQQSLYVVVSLRSHYEFHKAELIPKKCKGIEEHLLDILVMYALADICFVVSGIFDLPWLLYIGIVHFNVMPLYLVYAHKQRMDAALKPRQYMFSKEPKKTI